MGSQEAPVFIVGTPRSGTTLLRLIIDSHPDIAITPESSFLFRKTSLWNALYPDLSYKLAIQEFIDDLRKLPQVKDWLPDLCTADELITRTPIIRSLSDTLNAVYSYYAFSKGKKRWGDKTPKNLHAVDQILQLFPDAKIVIMVRDSRDVAMSLSKADFSKISYISAANRWQQDSYITKQLIQKYTDQIYLLKYEDLLENPEKSIKNILHFFNLSDYPEIMKRYTEHEDDVAHTKSILYMKPVSKENLYKWKQEMSLLDIGECEAITKEGLEYFGYKVVSDNPTISLTKVLLQRIKDFFQLLVNKKNMENYYVYARFYMKLIFERIR